MALSAFELSLQKLRQDKLRQIEALGREAYPNSYPATHTIPTIWAEHRGSTAEQLEAERVPVAVAGRLMTIRAQGKAGFAHLQQGGERLQIYVRQDAVGVEDFAVYKLLDAGDHVGVSGYLFRTRTGELSVHVETLTLLAKAMLALPEKYHGLTDVELRYRQRYVDLLMNTELELEPPGAEGHGAEDKHGVSGELEASGEPAGRLQDPAVPGMRVRDVFVKRAGILRAVRAFFDARGYLEVETPMMQPVAGGAAARPFTTHHNALDLDLYLRIAPELYLKRLVVGGLDRVYEINRNFRNEGVSTQHNPEFTMLEFYQAYSNYHDLMDLTKDLIIFVAQEVNGTTKTRFNGQEIDLSKWQQYTMREAIVAFWKKEPFGRTLTTQDIADAASLKDFLAQAREFFFFKNPDNVGARSESVQPASIDFQRAQYTNAYLGVAEKKLAEGAAFGSAIASVFEGVAEPYMVQPTIIYDFPLAISPLSKQKAGEPEWVERFEFYIGGFEVGNAFSELNDPAEQRRRFEQQLGERARGDEEAHAMDEDYLRALAYGLPPTAGEGIGIDRLTMILTGARSIRDVILFPLLRPEAE